MKLKSLTKKQFIYWLAASGLAVFLAIFLPYQMLGLAVGVFNLSTLILLPREERHQLFQRKQAVQLFCFVAVFAVGIFMLNSIPKERLLEILRFMHHPGFILPPWIFMIWRAYHLRQLGYLLELTAQQNAAERPATRLKSNLK
ncbi:MAG: hypothetical protein L3J39_06400 [Verrucomicrobiales bacterium]|nr:hypothetical protein [Verrucomicrobiales bacterium]